MTKPVITIHHEDYVDRVDDEGRVFIAYRTIRTAADLWMFEEPKHREWRSAGDDSDVSFAWIDDQGTLRTTLIAPDSNIEDLYEYAALPFDIDVVHPVFVVGDVLQVQVPGDTITKRTSWYVHQVRPNGSLRVSTSGHIDEGIDGTILPKDFSLWVKVGTFTPAPPLEAHTPAAVRTFVVTMPADATHANVLASWARTEADLGITVREAR